MEFFKASIGGVSYGAGITEVERSNAESTGGCRATARFHQAVGLMTLETLSVNCSKEAFYSAFGFCKEASRKGETLPEYDEAALAKYRENYFNFYDSRLMDGAWQHETDPHRIEMFFRLLAVCHTVVPCSPQNEKEIKYEAESPDEAALVVAAKVMGFFFYARTASSVTVSLCAFAAGAWKCSSSKRTLASAANAQREESAKQLFSRLPTSQRHDGYNGYNGEYLSGQQALASMRKPSTAQSRTSASTHSKVKTCSASTI
eukprot:1148316-Pelagomonas_calceolata.AAC.4